VSVSCGIPDFRSKNGIYSRLAVDFPDLPNPQAMFDIHYFRNEQRPFFKFAKVRKNAVKKKETEINTIKYMLCGFTVLFDSISSVYSNFN